MKISKKLVVPLLATLYLVFLIYSTEGTNTLKRLGTHGPPYLVHLTNEYNSNFEKFGESDFSPRTGRRRHDNISNPYSSVKLSKVTNLFKKLIEDSPTYQTTHRLIGLELYVSDEEVYLPQMNKSEDGIKFVRSPDTVYIQLRSMMLCGDQVKPRWYVVYQDVVSCKNLDSLAMSKEVERAFNRLDGFINEELMTKEKIDAEKSLKINNVVF